MRLELQNWMRFRGEHAIELGPKVYGLIGQWNGNPRRSNWAGKTSLLEAFRFALFGVHQFTLDDQWITNGEDEGRVALEIGDTAIIRTRKRGTASRLMVSQGDSRTLLGDAAQDAITGLVGLTREEWLTLCWFGQKRTSAYVLESSSARFSKVREWCGMALLEDAHTRESATLRMLENEQQKIIGERAACVAGIDNARRAIASLAPESVDAIERAASDAAAEHRRAQDERLDLEKKLEATRARERAEELERTVREQRAALPTPPNDRALAIARAAATNASAAVGEVARKRRTLAALANGNFDGKCPVTCEACPSADWVNTHSEKARHAYEETDREYAAKNLEARKCAELEQKLATERNDYQRKAAAADTSSALLAKLTTTGEAVERLSDLRERLAHLSAQSMALGIRAQNLAKDVERVHVHAEQIESFEAQIVTLDERAKEAQAQRDISKKALRVLGKSGAQRIVGRGFTAQLDATACEILNDAGVALSVSHRWGRPTAGFEAECPKCGADAGRSKAKKCGACGADREVAFTDELDVVLSNRSGAAEDLAGLALQLGASELVRRARGSRWSTVFVDEPFGSLDEEHVSGVASHISQALCGPHGFERAIVVAHHRGVVTGMQGLIVVEADESGSRVRVE